MSSAAFELKVRQVTSFRYEIAVRDATTSMCGASLRILMIETAWSGSVWLEIRYFAFDSGLERMFTIDHLSSQIGWMSPGATQKRSSRSRTD